MRAEEQAQGQQRKPRKSSGKSSSGALSKAFGGDKRDNPEYRWDECDPRYLQWVLVNVGDLGGAVTFGRSRDKAALSVTLLLDGDRHTEWISPSDNLEEKLTEIAEKLAALQ